MDEMFFLPTVLSKNDTMHKQISNVPFYRALIFLSPAQCPMKQEAQIQVRGLQNTLNLFIHYTLVLDCNLTQT